MSFINIPTSPVFKFLKLPDRWLHCDRMQQLLSWLHRKIGSCARTLPAKPPRAPSMVFTRARSARSTQTTTTAITATIPKPATTNKKVAAKQTKKTPSTNPNTSALQPRPTPLDLPIITFPDVPSFSSFLAANHSTSPGIWLKFARKSSGNRSIASAEALEVALCYGWINGQGQKCPESEGGSDWYLARYTPRRPKSLWSQVNVELIEKLDREGRMKPAGWAAVEAAKGDGRWERAYARPRDIVAAEDFLEVLREEGNDAARAFYEGLSKGKRYYVLVNVEMASVKARPGRIRAVVDGLSIGKIPGEKKR